MEKNEALDILEVSKPSCAIRETIIGFVGDDKGITFDRTQTP